jgi:hypothetical protein
MWISFLMQETENPTPDNASPISPGPRRGSFDYSRKNSASNVNIDDSKQSQGPLEEQTAVIEGSAESQQERTTKTGGVFFGLFG